MLKKLFLLLFILSFCGTLGYAAKKTISLPQPQITGKMSVEESIFRRRSEHSFYPNELSMEQIAQLLFAGQGITDRTWGFRSAPSSGALYPMNLYVVKKDGVFEYIPESHKLVQIVEEDRRPSLVRASLGQAFIGEAPVVIVIAGNFRITYAKFGQRAYRYINMEAGHIAENIHLQAIAMGMAAIAVGGFWDDVVANALELPDTRDPFYIIPIGYFKPSS